MHPNREPYNNEPIFPSKTEEGYLLKIHKATIDPKNGPAGIILVRLPSDQDFKHNVVSKIIDKPVCKPL
tara:strand:+ start:895 stop:1101 length:207 start_codon:yes stop_codon:yes gene_type:complete